eukprot:TRINITY_DN1346_c0_g1_i2.p1 TRINITY_DN1346_c0_g1~~TRINITY_DN1346_c0_g1_i2.p1  ORF type:complete len:107 (-),score=17.73 TRINITY_DN1346_c0_g1_i2:249-569(-)
MMTITIGHSSMADLLMHRMALSLIIKLKTKSSKRKYFDLATDIIAMLGLCGALLLIDRVAILVLNLPCCGAANLLGEILTFLYMLGFVFLLGLSVTDIGVLGVAFL